MFSSEKRGGRLVELRVVTPTSTAEMLDLQKTHLQVTGSVEGDCVVVVDPRRARGFPSRSPTASSA